MIGQAHSLIESVKVEMESYYHARSEQWQESERGESFIEKIGLVEEVASLMGDLT